MKLGPVAIPIAAFVSFLTLASCDQLLSVNLFKEAGLGQQETPSASDLRTMPVSEMTDLTESPTFFEDLAGDAGLKQAALDGLQTQIASTDPGTKQDAAALAALIELKTTDAFDAVNGIFNAVDDL